MGISDGNTGVMAGTSGGEVSTRDICRLRGGEQWNKKLVLVMKTSLAKRLKPELVKPETVVMV